MSTIAMVFALKADRLGRARRAGCLRVRARLRHNPPDPLPRHAFDASIAGGGGKRGSASETWSRHQDLANEIAYSSMRQRSPRKPYLPGQTTTSLQAAKARRLPCLQLVPESKKIVNCVVGPSLGIVFVFFPQRSWPIRARRSHRPTLRAVRRTAIRQWPSASVVTRGGGSKARGPWQAQKRRKGRGKRESG